jgi:uncharacterized protein YecE (DUF72 family)
MSELLFGTCGWSYAEWEGIFYPERQNKLKQYSSIFPTAEIDSTFYALPNEGTVLGWVRHTPPHFVFSAKLPQTITHKKVIDPTREIVADLDQFLEAMKPLRDAGKLACFLVQLPGFLKFDVERLEAFLSLLPHDQRFAVEFRHHSWLRDETFRLLEEYGAAYTIVDEPLLPPEVHVTSDLAYIRWHGRGSKPWFNYKYSEEQLQEWVPRVKETAGKAKKVLGYFNNHFHGYAPENSLQLTQMLGIVTPHGSAALRRLTYQAWERPAALKGLEAWTGPIGEKGVEGALRSFVDSDILQAAQSIPDKDLSLREDSRGRLAAYVADTTVDIDLEERTIVHRCPTWSRLILEKGFCPHVARVFLMVDRGRALSLLSLIQSDLENWKFESRLAVEFPT